MRCQDVGYLFVRQRIEDADRTAFKGDPPGEADPEFNVERRNSAVGIELVVVAVGCGPHQGRAGRIEQVNGAGRRAVDPDHCGEDGEENGHVGRFVAGRPLGGRDLHGGEGGVRGAQRSGLEPGVRTVVLKVFDGGDGAGRGQGETRHDDGRLDHPEAVEGGRVADEEDIETDERHDGRGHSADPIRHGGGKTNA